MARHCVVGFFVVVLALGAFVCPAAAERVHPELDHQLKRGHPAAVHDVIVELVAQSDPHTLAANSLTPARLHRRAAVIAGLRALAHQTQGPIVTFLASQQAAGHVKRFEPLWILNAVAVRATEPVIRALAARSDVWEVRPDRQIPPPAPVPASVSFTSPPVTEWNIAKIRAPEVWARGYDGTGAVIGSFDTGVDPWHSVLFTRYRGNDAISWFDPYGEHATPFDAHGHGTHTTGTALGGVATGGSAIGVAPGAKWIAAKAWNDSDVGFTSAFHLIFQWFLAPGGDPANAPDVVNNSWSIIDAGCISEFRAAIEAWRAAGIFPAFAAGNQGAEGAGSARAPGADPASFAVGATDSTDAIASFSGRGPSVCDGFVKPDISAPGVNVWSALPGDSYGSGTGTSMASPHVAGAVAVLRSINQALTVDQIETLLAQSAVDLGSAGPDNAYGAGRLDLAAAVTSLIGPPVLPPDLKISSLTNPPTTINLGTSFKVTSTTANTGGPAPATTTAFYLSTTAVKQLSALRFAATRAVLALGPGATSTGITTLKVAASTPEGTYFLIACADDTGTAAEASGESNNCQTASTTVLVKAPDLTVTAVSAPPATAPRGGSFQMTDTVVNQGTATTAASTVRYYLSRDGIKGIGDALLTGTRPVGILAPQGVSTSNATITVSSTMALGTYYVLACADDLKTVVEALETNNCMPSPTTVQILGPDLIVSFVDNPPATVRRGTSFVVNDTVVNQGVTAMIVTTTVRYYLSKDTIKGSDVLLSGTRTVDLLAPNASSSGTVSVTVPSTASLVSYFVLVCADDLKQALENSDANNCRASATKVLITP